MGQYNKILFYGVLLGLGAVVVLLSFTAVGVTEWPSTSVEPKRFLGILPVLFTSFGFQVVFHTLMDYCKGNAKMLRSIFFWGSLIPFVVYLLWTQGALVVLFGKIPKNLLGSTDVLGHSVTPTAVNDSRMTTAPKPSNTP